MLGRYLSGRNNDELHPSPIISRLTNFALLRVLGGSTHSRAKQTRILALVQRAADGEARRGVTDLAIIHR